MVDFAGRLDTSGVRRVASGLRSMGRLAADSVNDTARAARDTSVSRITRHLNLAESYVEDKFSLRRASPQRPTAFVIALDRPVQVRQYDARQEYTDGGRKAGVSVQILRGGARKTLRSAFFGRLNSGAGIGVFGRKSQARYPLRVLYAPSPGQMFKTITPEMAEPLLRKLVGDLLARTEGAFDATAVGYQLSSSR